MTNNSKIVAIVSFVAALCGIAVAFFGNDWLGRYFNGDPGASVNLEAPVEEIQEITLTWSEATKYFERELDKAIRLRETENYEAAEKKFLELQKFVILEFGEVSEEYARLLNHFGSVYTGLNNPRKRVEIFEKAVSIYTEIFGSDSARVAENLINLGGPLRKMGRYQEAKESVESGLKILGSLGQKDRIFGVGVEILGSIEWDAGRLPVALEHYGEALEIIERTAGKTHINFIDLTFNKGWLLSEMGRCTESKDTFKQALDSLASAGLFKKDHHRSGERKMNSLPC